MPNVRHPVADAFGFAKEYERAALLILPASATYKEPTVLAEVGVGDRAHQTITQVGGRIVMEIEIIRYWDKEALAESDKKV